MRTRREYRVSGDESGTMSVFAETVTRPTSINKSESVVKFELITGLPVSTSYKGLLQLAKQIVEIVEIEEKNNKEGSYDPNSNS